MRLAWPVLVLVIAGCAAPARQQAVAREPLARPPTVFIRVYGHGRAPAINTPVVYRLCIDFARGTLADVQDPDDGHSVDDVLANVLRGWKWRVSSTVRLNSGIKCWRERFERDRAVAQEPTRMLGIDDGAVGPVGVLRDETDREVAFIDSFDADGIHYVLLLPRVAVSELRPLAPSGTPPVPPLNSQSHAMPHLPDVVKLRYTHHTPMAEYELCFGSDGNVSRIVAEVPIDGAAAAIGDTLRGWHMAYTTRVCGLVRFVFTID